MTPNPHEAGVKVGICVLNYHQPGETVHCIETLLRKEPPTTRILWIENDAAASELSLRAALGKAPFPWVMLAGDARELPEAGVVGILLSPENLGYAGGNNLGLRLLHAAGVPYAWVLNNDTELVEGCSEDLAAAAEARPEVGAWGATIREDEAAYSGGIISPEDYASRHALGGAALEASDRSYACGCSLFMPLTWAAEAGFIPEDFFLYYEDVAFGFELRRRGHPQSAVDRVVVRHAGSLSTGRRSPQVEYYNRRNRWEFIRRYFPAELGAQRRRIFYTLQKFLFRGRLDRARVELMAYRDFRQGKLGRTGRPL